MLTFAVHLVGVRAGDADRVEQVFQAVWDGPEVESHLPCDECVGVVKQVDVAPGQRTVLLQENTSKVMHRKMISEATAQGYGTNRCRAEHRDGCLLPMPTLTDINCFDLNENQRRIDLNENC